MLYNPARRDSSLDLALAWSALLIATFVRKLDPDVDWFDSSLIGIAGVWVLAYFVGTFLGPIGLKIPAGDPNYESHSQLVFEQDAQLVWMQPHMHLRGKDFEYRLIYPTGESETVFRGKFDFNWQQGFTFEKPIPLPKGTRLVGIAHFDNSTKNLYNPDPTKTVRWGDQTWEEMMIGFYTTFVDVPAGNRTTAGQQ